MDLQTGEQKQYWSTPEDGDCLEVRVVEAGGHSVAGALIDASIGGAKVRFCGASSPALVIGQEVQLSLTSQVLKKPLDVLALVLGRTEEEADARGYRFRFTDNSQLQRRLPPELYRIFNRRGMYRVEPSAKDPVGVVLSREGGEEIRARCIDISGSGVGVGVKTTEDVEFVGTTRVKVRLSLPGCTRSISLEGVIRNRKLVEVEIHYGIEFDLEQADQAEQRQDDIVGYVMKRQREIRQQQKTGALQPT